MNHLRNLHVKLDVQEVWCGSFHTAGAKALLDPIKRVAIAGQFMLTLPFLPDIFDGFRRCHPLYADRSGPELIHGMSSTM